MSMHVLITGGAGFIGSHLADTLLTRRYKVRILDNLSEQVHGSAARPPYLNAHAELIVGDVRDPQSVRRALRNIDAVFHFAAAVGVGQSMYMIEHYTDTNTTGTAVLLEELIRNPVGRLITASSMSIYGEGLYQSARGQLYQHAERTFAQLQRSDWELYDEFGEVLIPIATSETKSPSLSSVYALTKFNQERLCLMVGRAYSIPTVALRFFNVYGPHQALSNPYTGVLAIFASRLLNNNAPLIYEDGSQQRDFVSVYDVAEACRQALEAPDAAGHVFNIGSGNSYTIRDIALLMATVLGKPDIHPVITGRYRVGDIRHCFADIRCAREVLGYEPKVMLEQGIQELAAWLQGETARDTFDEAHAELMSRGLTL